MIFGRGKPKRGQPRARAEGIRPEDAARFSANPDKPPVRAARTTKDDSGEVLAYGDMKNPDAVSDPAEVAELKGTLNNLHHELSQIKDKTPTVDGKLQEIRDMLEGKQILERGKVRLLEMEVQDLKKTYGDIAAM